MIPAINWFDLLVILLILLGVYQGRRDGMTGELFGFLYWACVVVVAGIGHGWVGGMIQSKTPLEGRFCLVVGYLLIAMVLKLGFERLKTSKADTVAKADWFRGMEYYLGMLAGGIRVLCIVVAIMAVTHSIHISEAQRSAAKRVQRESFGAVFFPSFVLIHSAVYYESFFGRQLLGHAGWLVIPMLPPGAPAPPPISLRRALDPSLE